jgi:hypothetical protein
MLKPELDYQVVEFVLSQRPASPKRVAEVLSSLALSIFHADIQYGYVQKGALFLMFGDPCLT